MQTTKRQHKTKTFGAREKQHQKETEKNKNCNGKKKQ